MEPFFSLNQRRHAFLQERSQKYLQNELLESIHQTITCSVLRGRAPQKRPLGDGDVRGKKVKKMTSKVLGIKLVKLLIVLIETNTLFNRYCVHQPLLLIPEKATLLQQNATNLDYLELVEREKKRVDEFFYCLTLLFINF